MPANAREKAIAGVTAKAIQKLQKRDVLLEQDLATTDETMTVKAFMKAGSEKFGREIKIKQWVLFAIKLFNF